MLVHIADVRDLYELLLQKEAIENRLGGPQPPQALQQGHEIVRKSNRTPSLRLRFGRRADPLLAVRTHSCGVHLFVVRNKQCGPVRNSFLNGSAERCYNVLT